MNKKIILLEHRPDYRAIYGLNLTVYIGVEVLVAITVREVVKYLEDYECTLIFIDAKSYVIDVGLEVFNHLSKKNLHIPCFIVGQTKALQDVVTVFDSKIDLKNILHNIAKVLNVTSMSMYQAKHPKYFPLPIEFILPGWECACPLYKKVSVEQVAVSSEQVSPEQAADQNYELLFDTGSVILNDTLEALECGDIKYLYVDAKLRLKFVNSLTMQISAKLNDPNLTYTEKILTVAKAYQMIQEQSRRIGIAESTIALANECIKAMNSIIEFSPDLNSLLQGLYQQDSSYLYRHSLLINYIGAHIIKNMNWGSREQQEKFSFVAFFHDIILNNDEMAKFRTDSEVYNSKLPEEQKKLVLNHALDSAKLLSKVKSIPFGADTIIKQHHGNKNGKSLSDISLGISPMAIVFIFAEEYAHIILSNKDSSREIDNYAIIRMLSSKYNLPAFNKVLPVLKTLKLTV
ncbi:MAG: hypothetical protein HQK51_12515 [Oligoflexia bacterium]|nr:hypothetical protein [Oligoflexia bacterium]